MKAIGFIFGAITGFVFEAIAGFVFSAITGFVFVTINLLHNYSGKYLLQIKIKLKKTVVYLDRNYSRYIYFYQYFCYKY